MLIKIFTLAQENCLYTGIKRKQYTNLVTGTGTCIYQNRTICSIQIRFWQNNFDQDGSAKLVLLLPVSMHTDVI